MVFSPAWGGFSPIPLVKHGQLRQYLQALREIRTPPPILAGVVVTPASIPRIVGMALASAGFMAAYSRAIGIAPERVDSEQLFRDIKAFLKAQPRVSPRGQRQRPPKKAIPGSPFEPGDHDYEEPGFFTFVTKRRKRKRAGFYTPSVKGSI